jgi:alpha-2-macroglobulin
MRKIAYLSLLLLFTCAQAADLKKPGKSGVTASSMQKQIDQGLFREAADAGKQALEANQASGELLTLTLQALRSLADPEAEMEQVINAAVEQTPQRWDILLAAARGYQGFSHTGIQRGDGFRRTGQHSGDGEWVSVQARDRVRALQLCQQAWETMPEPVQPEQMPMLLAFYEEVLQAGSSASELLRLTDLQQLPEAESNHHNRFFYASRNGNYPVTADGKPCFFSQPRSWDSAVNDGQRLCWLWHLQENLGGEAARAAHQKRASLALQWFGVQSVTELSPQQREQLPQITEKESFVHLATGTKKISLPPEWNPIGLHAKLTKNADPNVACQASLTLAAELNERRQHPRALEVLNGALALKVREDELRERIQEITTESGVFQPVDAQPAGREATLPFVYRNAAQAELTARRVDLAQLLDDTVAYLRSEPAEQESRRMNLNTIGARLLDQNQAKYLSKKPSAKWSVQLQPQPGYAETLAELKTPLKEAGAYLVEATFPSGGKARTLLWIEGLVLVQAKQKNGHHTFVADALTGAPVPDAKVQWLAYQMQWKDSSTKPRYEYKFKDKQTRSDAQGQFTLSEVADNDSWQTLTRVTTADGRIAFLGFDHQYFWQPPNRSERPQPVFYAITDRPVYRPGQEVKFKTWLRIVSYDSKVKANAFRGQKVRLTIEDPKGEEVQKQTLTLDDWGAADANLNLPADAALGTYSMSFDVPNGFLKEDWVFSHSFRVEEYKKPEFEVTVSLPEKPVLLGEAFQVKAQARYYFGTPVKQGKLKYKVQRSTQTQGWFPPGPWDWLYGTGYGYRHSFYDWYPKTRGYRCCIPCWPWLPQRTDPPELVAEGEAVLDAEGQFSIRLDTASAKQQHGEEDHRYEVQVEVTDSSRRTLFGQGSVLVTPEPFQVHLALDHGYYRQGDHAQVSTYVRTPDGQPLTASGSLRVLKIQFDAKGEPNEKEVSTFPITTSAELPVALTQITWSAPGQYRLSAKIKNAAGHAVEGTCFINVLGNQTTTRPIKEDARFDDLELIIEKTEYAPGDEVELLVQTNQPGSHVALFIRPENGVYPAPVWLKMDGQQTTYRFRLDEVDQPKLFIEAYTVKEAQVHSLIRQILLPPKKRIATLKLQPDASTYQPGQTAKAQFQITDADGKPFQGEVVLTAYDKALEYIASSQQQDIRQAFWSASVNHQSSLRNSAHGSEVYLYHPEEKPMRPLSRFSPFLNYGGQVQPFGDASGMAGGMRRRSAKKELAVSTSMAPMPAQALMDTGRNEAPPPAPASAEPEASAAAAQPILRTRLADAAVWVASFKTDAQGQGDLSFQLPENLTTWRLRAWVMGQDAQVGEASVEIITRKDVMVRLQAPRFFVEKDEVVLSSIIHNELAEPQRLTALLELEGGVLEVIQAPDSLVSEIPAHAEKRYDWRVKVLREGQATIRVKALGQKDSDAMQMSFPAHVHGTQKLDAWSLALRPEQSNQKLTINVPAERRPELSRLVVRATPSLAMTCVEALPYLASYPHGCTEQTLNRFVPTVITLKVLKDLGVDLKDVKAKLAAQKPQPNTPKNPVFDEAEVQAMARTGLKRLEAMQSGDGGWAWFPGARESSPHITAQVVQGLQRAQRAGLQVNEGLIQQGLDFLKRHEARELALLALPKNKPEHKSHPDDLDALVHHVLDQNGSTQMRNRLYENRTQLAHSSLALLALTLHSVGDAAGATMCLRNLKQHLKEDAENQTAWLELPSTGWWHWWQDDLETQAAFLRLLSQLEPKTSLPSRIAKYLVQNRRHGTYWNSTRDTATIIAALAEYMQASGETKPDVTYELRVDGQVQKTVTFTPQNLFTADATWVLEAAALTTGPHELSFSKKGSKNSLYINAYLSVFSKEDSIPAAGLEIKVERQFYRITDEKRQQTVNDSNGQPLSQNSLKEVREKLASAADIRSGDLIEVDLLITSKNDYEYVLIEDFKPAGVETVNVQSGWLYDRGLSLYQEFRDNRVSFYTSTLPQGQHSLRYRVKAEIPGHFSALPAHVEAMYSPDLKANSNEWKAHVRD